MNKETTSTTPDTTAPDKVWRDITYNGELGRVGTGTAGTTLGGVLFDLGRREVTSEEARALAQALLGAASQIEPGGAGTLQDVLNAIPVDPPETLPAVECTPWCMYGDGHTDALGPDDQHCYSEAVKVQLTSQRLLHSGRSQYRDAFEVYLGKKATHVAATVTIERYGKGGDVDLSRTEALALSDALRGLAERM